MKHKFSFFKIITATLLGGLIGWVTPAHAQPNLVASTPAPDALLSTSPETIILEFDRALSNEGSWVEVTNEAGETFNTNNGKIDPDNRARLLTAVQALPEGRYRVTYNAVGIGSSTVSVGSFNFTIDLPEPTLSIISPVDGEAFTNPIILMQFEVQFFDFGRYDNRIGLYVDGDKVEEIQSLDYTLEGLSPGVHEIRAVLLRFEGEVLPETASAVTIAIAQSDVELAGREAAAEAPPDPGLQLTVLQWIGIIGLTGILLGAGFWLGKPSGQANP